ncbi:MAG: phosphotransferase [Candidatus Poribacteria bacterium]|nr:phosphotransferase [Candidatus Poribacteria bacterium]
MALLSIPNTPDDITPQWLTEALCSTRIPPNVVVTSLRIEPIAELTCAGQLARLHLSFSQPQSILPRTLVAKLHAPDEPLRAKTRPFTPDKCEILFYQQLAKETHLRTPHCYYSTMNVTDGKYVRILEDLAPAKVGDQIRGSTVEETALALRAIAGFHAYWWQSEKLEEFDELVGSSTDSDAIARWVLDQYQNAFPIFVNKAGTFLTDAAKIFGEQLPEKLTNKPQFRKPPKTLVHGDFRLENVFFGASLGKQGFAVIDWQDISRGEGVGDIAWFIGGCLQVTSNRQVEEQQLLKVYHETLKANGVNGYTFEACWEDYCLAMSRYFVQAVLMVASLNPENDRENKLAQAVAERFIAAITDLHLTEN